MEVGTIEENSSSSTLPEGSDDQKQWEIEKAQLEQVNFNLNQELTDAKERLREVAQKNATMLDELSRHGSEISESAKRRRTLESTRNELTERNIELENTVARLRIEKEDRDNALANANKEKQTALVEMFALKDQLKQLSDEKTNLALMLDTFQHDQRTIQFEREKFSAEREMYNESKKWLMQEVSERDNRISALRLELSTKDIELTNDRLQLESEISNLTVQLEGLNDKLASARELNAEMLTKMEELETNNTAQVANLEAELRCQAELTSILKNSMEESKQAADKFRDDLVTRDAVINEVKALLSEVTEEVERDRLNFSQQLAEKNEEIENLKQELENVNESLRSRHAVNVNATEEELAAMSPAAAETARLLKGGQSLTAIVREHARVVGELTAVKEERDHLIGTLGELVEQLQENGQHLNAQRNITDSIFDKNERFEKQLSDAEKERQMLMNQRDSAQRELAFTQAELEKYQRDYEFVMKRNAELMYASERQNHADDPNWDNLSDEKLFTTIVTLQQRNVQLESDIENEKKSAAQSAMNAQNAQMAELKSELASAQAVESKLRSQIDQLKVAMKLVQDQADHFRELVRDSVSATEARNARIKAEEAYAVKSSLEMNVKRLEDFIALMKNEKEKNEQDLRQRLEAAETTVNNTKQTYITLQVALESQKSMTAEAQLALRLQEKEIEAAKKEVEKVLAADAKKAQKLAEYGKMLMESNENLGVLKVRLRALEDENASARSEIHYLKMENDSQRGVMQREQQLLTSLNEVSTRLSRVETEKLNNSNTQLEVIRLERDSLKSSAARLTDQLTHSKNESKLIQTKLENELTLVKSRLAEKEEQFNAAEKELVDLRSKLASIQAQYTGADMTGMTQERLRKEYQQLKNRTQFLESQLDEVNRKLLEVETEKLKRDDESAMVENHSKVLEKNLKDAERLGNLERERLEAKASSFEKRSEELSEALGQLREEHENLKLEFDTTRSTAERDLSELKRQLDVAKVHIEEIEDRFREANETIARAKNDLEVKDAEIRSINDQLEDLKDQLSNAGAQNSRIQSQLDEKSMALIAENEAKRQADEMRKQAEAELQKKVEERNEIERECRDKLAEYEQKLERLAQQYESINVSLNPLAADTSINVDPNESMTSSLADVTRNEHVQSNVVESLQNLLQFVRQEKDAAINRAMSAEIEMRRLRAETAEYESGRSMLLSKIRDLETEKTANAVALVERAKLIERVEALTNVQTINNQLNAEKERLQMMLDQTTLMKAEFSKKNELLTAKLNETNLKLSAVQQEVNLKSKEQEQLKKRMETTGRGQVAALQAQLEQAKALLSTAREEAAMASQHAKTMEAEKTKIEDKLKEENAKFLQVKKVAVRYRDESNELRAKYEKKSADGKPATVTPETSKSETDVKQKQDMEQLQKEVEQLRKEKEDADMAKIRMRIIEGNVEKMRQQLDTVTKERDSLMQSNIQLSRQVDSSTKINTVVSATDIETTKVPSSSSKQDSTTKQSPFASSAILSSGGSATKSIGGIISTTPSPFSPSNAVPMASSTPKQPQQQQHQQKSPPSQEVESEKTLTPTGLKVIKTKATPQQQAKVPPAPAASSPEKKAQQQNDRPISVPNEPMDVIPPVPSENIPDPTPPSNNPFTSSSMLPVPPAFQTSDRVPTQSLFTSSSSSSTTTTAATAVVVSEENQKKSVLPNIETIPPTQGVTYSLATSTLFGSQSGGVLFGKSGVVQPVISTSSSNVSSDMALPEESVAEAAGQSSLVSGSIDHGAELARKNNGESRDSTVVGGVSSSDGRRKRLAGTEDGTTAKRQRDSPNEAVTSSESRQQGNNNVAEIPGLDDEEDDVLVLEQEVSDEDPNETVQPRPVAVVQENVGLGNDEEVLEDEMEGEEEEDDDDESFGNDEEYEEDEDEPMEEEDQQMIRRNDDVITLDSDESEDDDADTLNDLEEGEEEEEEEEEGGEVEEEEEREEDEDDDNNVEDDGDDDDNENDIGEDSNANDDVIEVIGGEDSQPPLDDQDREAASAVEEAEDEGRDSLLAPGVVDESTAPADPTGASQPDFPRVRMPPSLLAREVEREDQCSSSNETTDATSSPSGAGGQGSSNDGGAGGERQLSARTLARMSRPVRGGAAKPARGLYQIRRGRGGGSGGSGGADV